MAAISRFILAGKASGPVLATNEGLSFWGGVDPASGKVIDIHHPLHGSCLSDRILFIPTTRGSCSGSGVLLDMILSGKAPAAIVFAEAEDVVTLGALIAAEMFDRTMPILRLAPDDFAILAAADRVTITDSAIASASHHVKLHVASHADLELSLEDQQVLAGAQGEAARQAMRIICAMANQQGAVRLIDVSQGHIDGCIYASPANLTFAEKMADMGARVRIPTTMNAISVDHENWRVQGIPAAFGAPAAQLADAYVRMGCKASFTCSPYLLDTAPEADDNIAWAESNAVIFANTVLGARTAKHPDFLDLCIAITGRAAESGVYLAQNRRPARIITVAMTDRINDAFWPLLGYVTGKLASDCIPLLRGIAGAKPSRENLQALCAAFGTTSAAPMLHIEAVTPEWQLAPLEDAESLDLTEQLLEENWALLNGGSSEVELVAIGSPHASLAECQALASALETTPADWPADWPAATRIRIMVTAERQIIAAAHQDGTLARLQKFGVQVVPDLCWCSISEPLFPSETRTVITNSGKYAHYGPGLSGRPVRLASLADCVQAARNGLMAPRAFGWRD